MIHQCLVQAGLGLVDLDAVVPGRGPGSFTGTRIALSTAKGIAMGSGVRILAVSSLEAAALDTGWMDGPVAVALDARKGEVLLATYRLERVQVVLGEGSLPVVKAVALIEPALLAPGQVEERLSGLEGRGRARVVGDAPEAWPEAFAGGEFDLAQAGAPLISNPCSLAWLALPRLSRAEADDPDGLEPVYSRPPPVHRG